MVPPLGRSFRLIGALLAFLAAPSAHAATSPKDDNAGAAEPAKEWPQYRGPQGTGHTQEDIPTPWPSSGPKTVWKVAAPGGFGSVAIAGGRAFTEVLREVDGAEQELLVALNADTGAELWATPLGAANYPDKGGNDGAPTNRGGDGPRTTPTVVTAAGVVIVADSRLVLHAFHVATGKPTWKRDLVREHNGRNIKWLNAASPLLDDGLLYVAGGGPGESLMALRPNDGSVVWKTGDHLITHATPTAATIHGVRQIIFFCQSGLVSVHAKSGEQLWTYKFPFRISTAAAPVLVGADVVYCSAGYGVGAGAVRITRDGTSWSASEIFRVPGDKLLANHWSTPVASGTHLYGMFQFKNYGNGPVKCVDAIAGKVQWEQPGFGPGNVILAGDKVLALTDSGELVAFAAEPGAYKELGRAKAISGKCWSTPALLNGRVYLRSTTEAVCIDLR